MTANLDAEIDAQHRAAELAEEQAVLVLQRMRQIPGLTTLVDKLPRKHGQVFNPYAAGTRNLTVVGLIERADPALATWLAKQAGASVTAPDYAAQERAAAKAAEVERMKEATQLAAAQNAQHQRAREQASLQGLHPLTGRRYGQ